MMSEETGSQGSEGSSVKEAVPTRAVNIGYELETIQQALSAVRILHETSINGALEAEDDTESCLSGVSAMLSLLACRVNDVRRVTLGLADPATIQAPHNVATEGDEEERPIRLRSWSPRKRRRWLKTELGRVRAQIAREK